jgi:murein DD-endopeptidase MepM/ murein hydrolase activator NlpD
LRPERPLTRRELREAEAAEARRAGFESEATDAAAPVPAAPAASYPAAVPVYAAAPQYSGQAPNAYEGQPASSFAAVPHGYSPAAPVQPSEWGQSSLPQPQQVQPQPPSPQLPPQPPSQQLPQQLAQQAHSHHVAQPLQLQHPLSRSEQPVPSHSAVDDALRLRRSTVRPPAPPSEAEPIDRPAGRDSAFGMSTAHEAPSNGFDDLFVGLGADVDAVDESATARVKRAGRGARAPKPSRAERKAAKAGGPIRGRGTNDVPPIPQATDAPFDLFAGIAPAVDRPPSAPTERMSVRQWQPSAASAHELGAPVEASAGREQTAQPGGLSTEPGAWNRGPQPAPRSGIATALRTPTSGDSAPRRGSARANARDAFPSSRPANVAAKRTPPRRSRASSRVASIIAMSFAAMLAIATSVPSLSLLSPADVQAMALESANEGSQGGQHVEITGEVLAQDIERDGYETQTMDEYARAAGIRPEATFTNNPAGTIQWPFAVGVHIGDRFGYRDCYGCSSNHGGQDFNPGYGAEIQAIADGTVAVSTDDGGSLGVVMMIDHQINGELITSVYAHMIEGSRRFEVGDTVHVADIVGQTGNTGMSTGPHLHFEIRVGGVDGTKIDPLVWLYENTN